MSDKASLEEILRKHPGYLGWTSQGVLAIHADWPAYAVEHGLAHSLLSLGQFPRGTRFALLDDIDQCFLFVAGDRPRNKEKFPDNRLYVALWHEDVAQLASHGYVLGAGGIPYQKWVKQRASDLFEARWQHPDGSLRPVPLPGPDDYEDLEAMRMVVGDGGLWLNEAGYVALEQLLLAQRDHIAEALMSRSRAVIQAQQYDSAVREACVIVETSMRSALGTKAYGQDLIDDFFKLAERSDRFVESQLKTFKTDVKSAFKFVRNEYAHSLQSITELECLAILVRMSIVYKGVMEIVSMLKE